MLECLILGDSIAVGTHMFHKECAMVGKGGINSWQWNKNYSISPLVKNGTYDTVIISLGTNDHPGVHTHKELEAARSKVQGKKVFWILPAIKPNIQQIVREVAAKHGDTVLEIRGLSKDKIHPSWAGYKDIVNRSR